MSTDKARIGVEGGRTSSGQDEDPGRVYGVYKEVSIENGVLCGDARISIKVGSFTRGQKRQKEKYRKAGGNISLEQRGIAHLHSSAEKDENGNACGDFLPYIEYNTARLGSPRKTQFFDNFDAIEKEMKETDPEYLKLINKDGMTPESIAASDDPEMKRWQGEYIEEIIFRNADLYRAFIDAGWPTNKVKLYESNTQLHATISEETALACDEFIEKRQEEHPDYGLSNLVNDSLATYFGKPELVTKSRAEKTIDILLGDYVLKRNSKPSNKRRHCLDGIVYSEDGKMKVRIFTGIRTKTIAEENLEERVYESAAELEAALRPHLGKEVTDPETGELSIIGLTAEDKNFIYRITLRNDSLRDAMEKSGWPQAYCANNWVTSMWDTVYNSRHGKNREPLLKAYDGERVFVYMTKYDAPHRVKANYECELDFAERLASGEEDAELYEYMALRTPPDKTMCLLFNRKPIGYPAEYTRVYDTDTLETEIKEKFKKYGDDIHIEKISTANKFLYSALKKSGWKKVSLAGKKRAISMSSKTELIEEVAKESIKKDITKTEVIQRAIDAYLASNE